MHVKLKTWNECIKANFYGRDVPCDMYCNAVTVLKIDSVYNQSKNYHPQVHIKDCKYINAESQQCYLCSD